MSIGSASLLFASAVLVSKILGVAGRTLASSPELTLDHMSAIESPEGMYQFDMHSQSEPFAELSAQSSLLHVESSRPGSIKISNDQVPPFQHITVDAPIPNIVDSSLDDGAAVQSAQSDSVSINVEIHRHSTGTDVSSIQPSSYMQIYTNNHSEFIDLGREGANDTDLQ